VTPVPTGPAGSRRRRGRPAPVRRGLPISARAAGGARYRPWEAPAAGPRPAPASRERRRNPGRGTGGRSDECRPGAHRTCAIRIPRWRTCAPGGRHGQRPAMVTVAAWSAPWRGAAGAGVRGAAKPSRGPRDRRGQGPRARERAGVRNPRGAGTFPVSSPSRTTRKRAGTAGGAAASVRGGPTGPSRGAGVSPPVPAGRTPADGDGAIRRGRVRRAVPHRRREGRRGSATAVGRAGSGGTASLRRASRRCARGRWRRVGRRSSHLTVSRGPPKSPLARATGPVTDPGAR